MQGVEQVGGDSPTMPSGSIDPVTDGILVDIDDTAGTPQRITFGRGPHRDRVTRFLHAYTEVRSYTRPSGLSVQVPPRLYRSTPYPGAPKTCPDTWCTAVVECRDRLHNGPDACQSRVGRNGCIVGEDSSMW